MKQRTMILTNRERDVQKTLSLNHGALAKDKSQVQTHR